MCDIVLVNAEHSRVCYQKQQLVEKSLVACFRALLTCGNSIAQNVSTFSLLPPEPLSLASSLRLPSFLGLRLLGPASVLNS